jgi:hypothetical protein
VSVPDESSGTRHNLHGTVEAVLGVTARKPEDVTEWHEYVTTSYIVVTQSWPIALDIPKAAR